MIDNMTPDEVDEVLTRQKVARIGCYDDGVTYVVPVMFVWHERAIYAYTTEGQKITMLRRNPVACVEVDEYDENGSWKSVIIHGRYDELIGERASDTLGLLSAKLSPPDNGAPAPRDRGTGRVPVAFRIVANEVTGRKVDRSLGDPRRGNPDQTPADPP